MLKTIPSEECFDNCKSIETKLKELLNTNKKLTLGDLLNVKMLKIKANGSILKCVKKQKFIKRQNDIHKIQRDQKEFIPESIFYHQTKMVEIKDKIR